jgi:diaminohydroxyphosphoribosylaminopyrimidine deaminase/5-amino-6-(5-phosphoribosylamino)uracil reductase
MDDRAHAEREIDLVPHDHAHLEWARKIARRGWGQVHPNPMVGCVLVRDGRVVGQGYHRVFGGPHAEIVALEEARSNANGATAYVSLEPCNHDGKTPPCTKALITAGVERVVFGASDPGAESGGGAEALRAAGIDVSGPVWTPEVGRSENPAFFHTSLHETPFVALKIAMSMDSKIAAAPGVRTRITGLDAEREVHRLRTGFDAVMVGGGTVRADDPRLTVRMVPPGRQSTRRVVLASELDLPADAALFEDTEDAPLHVFSRHDASESVIGRVEARGARVHPVPEGESGLDLDAVLATCRDLGMQSILCEGGAGLASSLLAERRVNRVYLFVAPTTLGSEGLAAFPDDANSLTWEHFHPAAPPQGFGRDTMIVLDRREH